MAPDTAQALRLIDAAHSEDPTKVDVEGTSVPYELHYAQKCTAYLEKHTTNPGPLLATAVRAQVRLMPWLLLRPDSNTSSTAFQTLGGSALILPRHKTGLLCMADISEKTPGPAGQGDLP